MLTLLPPHTIRDWCEATTILTQGDTDLALNNLRTLGRARRNDFSGDPHLATIDWMMAVNAQAGHRVAFSFTTGGQHAFDARYRMAEPVIRRLRRRIYEHDHAIGLHPGYMTYQHPDPDPA